MKAILIFLLASTLTSSGFAKQKNDGSSRFLIGGYHGEITKTQCSDLETSIQDRLEKFAVSENQPSDTFSVVTKAKPARYHNHFVELCYGSFRSKSADYTFLLNLGTHRYGSGGHLLCVEDHQNLENQLNVLSLKDEADIGWAFHRYCAVESISVEKRN